jgi:hypothetical protein
MTSGISFIEFMFSAEWRISYGETFDFHSAKEAMLENN